MERDNYWTNVARRRLGRRGVLRLGGASALGIAASSLIACGDDDDDSPTPTQAAGTSQPTPASGATSAPTQATGPITPTGTIRASWFSNGALQFWNPLWWVSGWQTLYREAIGDSLIGFERDGPDRFKYFNQLAETVERAPDGLSATFKLRPEAKFSDGSPVTSEDVKFTYEVIGTEGGRHARKAEWTKVLAGVDTPDEQTAVVRLNAPYPLLYTYNYMFPIISKAAFDKGADAFEENPVAAGPFKFVSGTKGTNVKVTAVEDHYRKTPFVKDYELSIVTEEATRVAQIQTGELDLAPISAPSKSTILDIDGARLASVPANQVNFLVFMDPYVVKSGTPTVDPRVREAMSLAVNRKGIVDSLLEGEAVLQGSFGRPVINGYAEIPPDEYNIEKAKLLLEAAGHGGGFDIDFYPGTPTPEYANVMVADWKKIGINVNIRNLDGVAQLAMTNGRATPGMYVQVTGNDYVDPGQWGLFVFSTGVFSYHDSPELDALMTKVTSATDDDQRAEDWSAVQKAVHEARVMNTMWALNTLTAVGPNVKEWEPIPGVGYILDVENAKV